MDSWTNGSLRQVSDRAEPALTGSAETKLGAALERINEGYNGKVNRNQLVVWLISKFAPKLEEAEIKEIRAEHLDEISAFEAFLRRAKETGKLPPELSAFIQKENGLDDAPRKKPKKNLQEYVPNGDIPKDDIFA
ncbi:MAG: hypothetical protein KF767_17690 [Bdellovibrionaceae bacterium]|nr:hypothetical protein [Pseudobdellovibrionaceae bacterium]